LKSTQANALKLTFAIEALFGAMTTLMYFSAKAAVGLQKFGILSDVSTTKLQDWQFAAAKFNVAGQDVADTILNIQNAQAQIELGEGNIGPWQFLGINPNQNPLDILWQVHLAIQKIRPEVARLMTSQMGISGDMFTFLRRPNLGLGELSEKYTLDQKDINDLAELNGEWNQLLIKIEAVGIKTASKLSPAFRDFFKEVLPYVEKLANWLVWLGGNTEGARKARESIEGIALGLIKVGVALPAVITGIKILTGLMSALSIASGPVGLTFAAIALAMVAIDRHSKVWAAQATARGVPSNGLIDSLRNPDDEKSKNFARGFRTEAEWNAAKVPGQSSLGATWDGLVGMIKNMALLRIQNPITVNVESTDPAAAGSSVIKALNAAKAKGNAATADQIFPSTAPATAFAPFAPAAP
jgi:hypothetical protein